MLLNENYCILIIIALKQENWQWLLYISNCLILFMYEYEFVYDMFEI